MTTRRERRERGAATIEMIYILPVMFLILFGIVELSRAWLTVSIITAAAREGARVGATTSPFSSAPALTKIDNILAGANLSTGASRSVTCTNTCQAGDEVDATVTVQFRTVAPAILPMLSSINLRETARFRYE